MTKDTDNKADKKKPDEQKKGIDNKAPREIGGPKGLEPTRYGDWEKGGIISDF